MTYELIRNFVTVAKSIIRATEILFVSQSTVSHRLRLNTFWIGAFAGVQSWILLSRITANSIFL